MCGYIIAFLIFSNQKRAVGIVGPNAIDSHKVEVGMQVGRSQCIREPHSIKYCVDPHEKEVKIENFISVHKADP